MARNQITPARPASLPHSEVLTAFSRELAERFPERLIKRFVMPARIREIREVFIRELTSRDEIEAAIIADGMMAQIEKESSKLTMEAERRESIRIAIVGVGHQSSDGSMRYDHTNTGGVPYGAPADWGLGAWTTLHRYFAEVNGVPTAELQEGIQEAQTVGAFASPIGGIPASADTGRSGASSGTNT